MKESFKTHGAFRWCELMTLDPEAAKRFYGRLFGGTPTTFPHSGARWRWIYRNFTTGSQIRIELNCGKGPASEDDPCIHKMGRSGRWVKEAMRAEGLRK